MKRWLWLVCLCWLVGGGVFAQVELECPKPLIDAPTPSYYIGLGDVAFARKNYSQAVLLYSCAIELQPDFAPTYIVRGYAHSELLDVDSAMADFDKAISLDETAVSAYVNRGALYTTQGNFGLAINDLTLAVTLDPNNVEALNNRAVVHAIEGNYDLAITDLETALSINENYAQAYATMAAVYSAMATQNYQKFVNIQGENARLPAGTPSQVIIDLDNSIKTGDFSVWLALLTPDR